MILSPFYFANGIKHAQRTLKNNNYCETLKTTNTSLDHVSFFFIIFHCGRLTNYLLAALSLSMFFFHFKSLILISCVDMFTVLALSRYNERINEWMQSRFTH